MLKSNDTNIYKTKRSNTDCHSHRVNDQELFTKTNMYTHDNAIMAHSQIKYI